MAVRLASPQYPAHAVHVVPQGTPTPGVMPGVVRPVLGGAPASGPRAAPVPVVDPGSGPAMAAMQGCLVSAGISHFQPGELIEAWSDGQQAWVQGEVLLVITTSGVFEGYSVRPGYLKLALEGGRSKWIIPEQVSEKVRRRSRGGSAVVVGKGRASSSSSPPLADCHAPLDAAGAEIRQRAGYGNRLVDAAVPAPPLFIEKSGSETLPSDEFGDASKSLARQIAEGHEVLAQAVFAFLQQAELAEVAEGDVVKSDFKPFEFRSRVDGAVERVILEMRIARGEFWEFSVDYKALWSGVLLRKPAMFEQLCKFGCGRCVQTGRTRTLRVYDTCCKKCAVSCGDGGHDDNCGGRRSQATAYRGYETLSCSPKAMLERWLTDEAQLRRDAANAALSAATVGDSLARAELDRSQAVDALTALLKPFGGPVALPNECIMSTYFKKADEDRDGRLSDGEFANFCKAVLLDLQGQWFPSRSLVYSTSTFVKQNRRRLDSVYRLGAKLGTGTFGVVYSVHHRISGEHRVCKQIHKGASAEAQVALQEIANMAMLDHPNVIKVYEYFDDGDYICQIMEPCVGGELQDKVSELRRHPRIDERPMQEATLRSIMKQLLRALAFMHSQNVVHRDLKPQNIMFTDKETDSIKVIDFGLAELLDKERCKTISGTLLYISPEAFQKIVTPKVDVWGAGVIMYNLLTGDFPYISPWKPPPASDPGYVQYVRDWEKRTREVIVSGEPNVDHIRLRLASQQCLDLMWSMLTKDAASRPDAERCLSHPWFSSTTEPPPTLSVGVMQNVEAFSRMPELKKAAFLLIAHHCSVEVLLELRALFTHFDVQNRGCLPAADLRNVLVQGGMTPLHAEQVVHGLDLDANGNVGWTEFMAAAIWVSIRFRPEAIEAAFATFDPEGRGKAKIDDFLRVLTEQPNREEWRKQLPSLLEEIHADVWPVDMRAGIHRLTKKMVGSPPSITKDEFQKWVKMDVEFWGGDALFSVQ